MAVAVIGDGLANVARGKRIIKTAVSPYEIQQPCITGGGGFRHLNAHSRLPESWCAIDSITGHGRGAQMP